MKANKLPSGNYRVQVLIGHDKNGKRIMKSFTAPKEWEALKMAQDYIDGNIDAAKKQLTVGEAVESYIDSRKDVIAPSTLYGYKIIASNRLQGIMDIKINEVTALDIQRSINRDAQNGLGYKSIKAAIALVRGALSLHGVTLPPLKSFKLPPKKAKKDDLPDLKKVLNVIIGSSVELPCLLAVWCGGMRISEVRGLRYEDIVATDDGIFIKVRRARVCLNGHDVLENCNKTEKSTRDIPLPYYIYNLIKAAPHGSREDYIIDENYGALKRRYDRLLFKNGIKMTFHELRAQFATTMNGLGVDREVLEMLGGWSNSKVLEEVYIRTPKSKLKESMKIFDDYMNSIIADNLKE